MFLGVNMFGFYVNILNKTPEVMILDIGVLHTRSYLLRNRACNHPLILFVKRD